MSTEQVSARQAKSNVLRCVVGDAMHYIPEDRRDLIRSGFHSTAGKDDHRMVIWDSSQDGGIGVVLYNPVVPERSKSGGNAYVSASLAHFNSGIQDWLLSPQDYPSVSLAEAALAASVQSTAQILSNEACSLLMGLVHPHDEDQGVITHGTRAMDVRFSVISRGTVTEGHAWADACFEYADDPKNIAKLVLADKSSFVRLREAYLALKAELDARLGTPTQARSKRLVGVGSVSAQHAQETDSNLMQDLSMGCKIAAPPICSVCKEGSE